MDADLFDRIAVAAASGASRRRLVRLLGAGSAAAALPWLGAREVAAADDERCVGQQTRNNRRCDAFSCAAGCVCTLTVSGNRDCLDDVPIPLSCPERDECDRNKDCPRGFACAKIGGCCGKPRRNVCLRKCT
jgi:hypothetical protein